MKINGTLCELSKSDITDSLAELKEIVEDAKYVCKKCARASRVEKHLCKPTKLPNS